PGEPVALLAPNGPDWVIARLGIAAAGAVAVAIDDLATEAEIAEILHDSAVRLVFASAAHAAQLMRSSPSLMVHVLADAPAAGVGWRRLFAEEAIPPPVPGEA